MNRSQLELYEKIKSIQSNKLNKIQEKVEDLELTLDCAILSERERELIDVVFMDLKIAIDDLGDSI